MRRERLAKYWRGRVAVVTGASRGLGHVLASRLLELGARVALAARNGERLEAAFARFAREETARSASGATWTCPADVTVGEDCRRLIDGTRERFGQIDAVFCVAGRSHRGRLAEVAPEDHRALWELNVLGTLQTLTPALPHLEAQRGHAVLIGSLASKLAGPFLGGYPASKFPVAAIAQQLRLETDPKKLHVLLVCPGPIRREDAGRRYDDVAADLPEQARKPGGGVRLRGLDPNRLADRILDACRRRRAELILPAKARIVLALSAVAPRWADAVIRRHMRG